MSALEELVSEIQDMQPEELRRMVVIYHVEYERAYSCWAFLRWVVVAQFALWCVWLA